MIRLSNSIRIRVEAFAAVVQTARTMKTETHLTTGSQPPTFPEDGKLRLYSMQFCPFAHRTHLVLEAKNIPYHVAYIDLKAKPEWLTQKSPLNKVPALEIPGEGDALIESLVIADYLDEKYPDNPLHSKDPLQKARDRILIERFNGFIGPLFKLLMSPEDKIPTEAIDSMKTALDIFESELKTRGTKFFHGNKAGWVDYMMWPFLERTDTLIFIIGDKFELEKSRFSKIHSYMAEMKNDAAVKTRNVSGENYFKFRFIH